MKWISIKDQQPKEYSICIAKTKYCICFYRYSSDPLNTLNGLFYIPTDGDCAWNKFCAGDMTHWMPLPDMTEGSFKSNKKILTKEVTDYFNKNLLGIDPKAFF
jgi:hypothetical protein